MAEDKEKREAMYLAIEMWQAGDLTQKEFCLRKKINLWVFGYWLRKYRKECSERSRQESSFLDVAVEPETNDTSTGELEIRYPNGVIVGCPADTHSDRLKTLINLV